MTIRLTTGALTAMIFAGAPVPVEAQVGETVAEFYQSCRAEGGRVDGRCDSYIEGAADTLAAFGKEATQTEFAEAAITRASLAESSWRGRRATGRSGPSRVWRA